MIATASDLQSTIVGTWVSLSVELRPQPARAGSGCSVESQFLTREFSYAADGTFLGRVEMYADPGRLVQLSALEFGGHLVWGDAHPVAVGAFDVDYVCDTAFAITPLVDAVAAGFNGPASGPDAPFAVGRRTSMLGDGPVIVDHDLLYVRQGLLFMGAKHVDGRQFDTPAARPVALQIPLIRAEVTP